MVRSHHLLHPTLTLMVLITGCGGRDEPRLSEWDGAAYRPREVAQYQFSGKRDGAVTRATAVFTIAGAEKLEIDLEITYNPTPALGSGRWRLDGPRGAAGEVREESIKFLGGQGEGPSLGGRFRLNENGNPRFLVVLPLRPVETSRWPGGP